MTSLEYAERTRISSILRSIMLDLSPNPSPQNSSSANQDFNLLGVVPPPHPCDPPPRSSPL